MKYSIGHAEMFIENTNLDSKKEIKEAMAYLDKEADLISKLTSKAVEKSDEALKKLAEDARSVHPYANKEFVIKNLEEKLQAVKDAYAEIDDLNEARHALEKLSLDFCQKASRH